MYKYRVLVFRRRAHIATAQWLTFGAKANFTGFSTTERDLQVRLGNPCEAVPIAINAKS